MYCWRHNIEALAALLIRCDGNPHIGPVMRSFGIFFNAIPKKLFKNSRIAGDLRGHDAHVMWL